MSLGPPLLASGRLLGGRYRVVRALAAGGFAQVYEVTHETLQSRHALKVLREATPTLRQRLLEEGRLQARLRHPGIVRVTDVVDLDGADLGGLGLVMDLVDGPSLAAFLASGAPPLDLAFRLGADILAAVAAAHERGLVHRDLKPENILLETIAGESWPRPRVTDFGLARALRATEGPRLTATGLGMGTPAYMAPEQFQDAAAVDARADVFSLGAVLFELVCGQRAFAAQQPMALFRQVCAGDHPAPDALVPGLPLAMLEAIESALEPHPDRRPDSAAALRALWCADGPPGPTDRDGASTADRQAGEADESAGDRTARDGGGATFGDGSVGGQTFGDGSLGFGATFGDGSVGGQTFGDGSVGGQTFGDESLGGQTFGDGSLGGGAPDGDGSLGGQTFGDGSLGAASPGGPTGGAPTDGPSLAPAVPAPAVSVGDGPRPPAARPGRRGWWLGAGLALAVGPLLAGVQATAALDRVVHTQALLALVGPLPAARTAVLLLPETADRRALRARYPALLDALVAAGVASITFDVAFSAASPDDAAFAAAAERARAAGVPVIAAARWGPDGLVPPASPELAAALQLGLATLETEGWRRIELGRVQAHAFSPEHGDLWALSVATLQSWTPRLPGPAFDDRTGALTVAGTAHPAPGGRFLLHPVATPPVLSLAGPWPELAGRAVLIGAPASEDRLLSRLGVVHGVFLQAAAVETLAAGRVPRPAPAPVGVLAALVAGVGTALVGLRTGRWWLGSAVGCVVLGVCLSQVPAGLLVPLLPVLVAVGLGLGLAWRAQVARARAPVSSGPGPG